MTLTIAYNDSPVLDESVLESVFSPLDATLVPIDQWDNETVIETASDANALIVEAYGPVDGDLIEALDDLQIIGRAGTGFDNIDVETATENEVVVVNAPNYSANEVATHALSLLLACRRELLQYDNDVKAGNWDWVPETPFPRVHGSTLGLISFGTIARKFADLASGFDLELLVYDPFIDEEALEGYNATLCSFDELLEGSDALSVHAPLTDETRGMIDAEALAALPDHAVVVNVGRGGIIDEDDLYEALVAGEIASAGLDVLAKEPPGDSPLFERDDVILTPHSAWYSADSRQTLNRTVADDVRRVLQSEAPENPVGDSGW